MSIGRFSRAAVLAAASWMASSLSGPAAQAQPRTVAHPAARGGGYEVELDGSLNVEAGGTLHLTGVAYRVEGLATLRRAPGTGVLATLTRRISDQSRARVVDTRVTAGAGGRFEISLAVPNEVLDEPRLELVVGGRQFDWTVDLRPGLRADLLTDRVLYQPGETVHVWSRVVRVASGVPMAQLPVLVSLTDASGQPIASGTVTTTAAGVAAHDYVLPTSVPDGSVSIQIVTTGRGLGASATRVVRVARRTVERLLLTATNETPVVAPRENVRIRVEVKTPSGVPVRDAVVRAFVPGVRDALAFDTQVDGIAHVSFPAPAFFTGSLQQYPIRIVAQHAALGTLETSTSVLVSRSAWLIAARPSNGALVPEVDATVYLTINSPDGRPLPRGRSVEVLGPLVRGGRVSVTSDGHGMAAVPVRLPRSAISRGAGGGCGAEAFATSFQVRVDAVSAQVCVVAAPDAEVAIRAQQTIAEAASTVAFEVQRRPVARGKSVLVEAVFNSRPFASTWLDANETRGRITLPRDLVGVVQLRARAAEAELTRKPLNEVGAAALGMGSLDAVLVRPAGSFALTLTPGAPLYHVRERAIVNARSAPNTDGWITYLGRDVAALGGEPAFRLDWLMRAFDEALTAPNAQDAETLLRATLTNEVSVDDEPARPSPLVPDPWYAGDIGYEPALATARGQVRDPVALREELLRREIGPWMVALEQAVTNLGSPEYDATGLVVRRGNRWDFHPDALAHLVENGAIGEAQTLGGEPVTVAMLTAADPSFTFDRVARRVARMRLVELLVALRNFTDGSNPRAARASSGEPPERWLSRMLALGMVSEVTMVDPWQKPFSFRRVGAERAAVVVSERAPEYELSSAGPDGAFGTGDDVRQPFERIVPAGTPYAVASNEDGMMAQLAALGPGPQVLQSMLEAYAQLGHEAADEERGGVVTATSSEADAPAAMDAESSIAFGGLGMMGTGQGGEGGGYGRGAGIARRAAPLIAGNLRVEEQNAPAPPPTPFDALGTRVREEFPATLVFVAEAPLDASGNTALAVPLLDALTTYRIEAIAWTRSGWTTNASTELRVDQDAMVDAPVPEVAVTGDVVRLPVRVQNHTAQPLRARVQVTGEEGLALRGTASAEVDVPAQDVAEVVLELTAAEASSGKVLVRVSRATDGAPLDAVRRPMVIRREGRPVRVQQELVALRSAVTELTVPDDAVPTRPSELRLVPGALLFGDPDRFATRVRATGMEGVLLALAGRRIPEYYREIARTNLAADGEDAVAPAAPIDAAYAVGVAWSDDSVGDGRLRAGLRAVSNLIPTEGAMMPDAPAVVETFARALLGLAPALRDVARRPGSREALEQVAAELRRHLERTAATSSGEASATNALAAVGLLLASPDGAATARARELGRRVEAGVLQVADEAWLESDAPDGTLASTVVPTAWLTIERAARGDADAALASLRYLVRRARTAERWSGEGRAAAMLAASLVARGTVDERAHVLVDGEEVRGTTEDGGVIVYALARLGEAGRHRIEIRREGAGAALATIVARYARPWTASPVRALPVAITLEGDTGARDTRAALALTIRNRGARVLSRASATIELPAGVELDQPTRDALTALLREAPSLEGRSLRLALPALAPGARVRLPLALRWSVAGRLSGLGVVVTDELDPAALAEAALAPRLVTLADHGPEPVQQTPVAPAPPARPEPPPPPIPMPLERLAPIAQVIR